MRLDALYALFLALLALLSSVDGASPAKKPPPQTASPARPRPSTPGLKAIVPTGNINGENIPNGSPSDTGCIDSCNNIYPPPAPDGNTANSLEIYYLAWFPSFKAGQTINMTFWSAYNPSSSAGGVPTTVNIDLYDQYGKVNLASIAQNVAVKASNTPFTLSTWAIPSSVNANFNVGDQFMIVFTGPNNWRRDRLLQIEGVTANPGGGLNPALGNAQIPISASGGGGGGSPSGTAPGTPGATPSSNSSAAGVRSDLWIVLCAWTFLIAQVVGFMLV